MKVEHEFYIGFRDIDRYNNLEIKALLGFLEDIAGMHSNMVGYGLKDIEKTKRTWMLISWKLKLYKKPQYADTIKIQTWSKSIQRLYAFRDFRIFNQEGELIGIASSKWVYINLETQSISRPEPEVVELYQSEDDSVFEESGLGKLKPAENYTNSATYTIGKEMIDVNNHVHNLYYLDLAYMALPEEVYDKDFSEIDILYKKEIKLGDTVRCLYSAEEDLITIKNEDESIIHAILKLK